MAVEKVVIIGSGPAAWSAAIYAARAELQPLVFEGAITEENRIAGTLPLGQLNLTTEVENYAGFPVGHLEAYLDSAIAKEARQGMAPHSKHGVSGPELMELMRQQAKNFGTRIVTDDIVKVDFKVHPFRLTALEGEVTETLTAIVATGARANYLGLPSEEAYKNRGVSACAVCDGALPRFRNKPLVVVGGGDSAVEEATFLTKFATKVSLIHRRDAFRASKIMVDRAKANPKVQFLLDTVVEKVQGSRETGVTGLKLKNVKTQAPSELKVDGLFVAIGHNPNTDIFKGQVDLDEKGYVKTQPNSTRTNIPGVFACGDVQDPVFRQAVTAAGSGCMAALEAERWLEH
ncbi:MAG TPA: thioredoxin-disulfide reductase [Pirellulales bacterium]|nr:thioredoxin-disulfide reductase [Pirellulales bacterium]